MDAMTTTPPDASTILAQWIAEENKVLQALPPPLLHLHPYLRLLQHKIRPQRPLLLRLQLLLQ